MPDATPADPDMQIAPVQHSRRMGAVSVVVVFGLWWLAALVVQATIPRGDIFLPTPSQVIAAIPRLSVFAGPGTELTYGNALWVIVTNTASSAVKLLGGLLIGSLLGVGLGLACGWNRPLRQVLEGPFLLIRVIPLFALMPLFLSWFGGSLAGAVTFVAFAVFSMLFVNTIEAINNVDPLVQVYARTLGASPFGVYRSVVVPAIVPELIGGARVVLGLSWAILLAAEFLAAQSGIGRIMILAQQYFDTSRMILIVLLIMLYTFALDRLVVALGARATRWVPRKQDRA
jgi:ABC-type nitrate/sulfonate/bicarbonate transport system permease component